MSTLTPPVQYCSQCSKAKKKKEKAYEIRKEEIKLTLCTNNMIVYIENHKDTTKKLPELTEFIKVTDYEGNTQKQILFLYQ